MLLRISDCDFNCLYQQGKKMFLSYALSHLASHNKKDGKESELSDLNVTIHDIDVNISESKTAEIQKETATNPRFATFDWIYYRQMAVIKQWLHRIPKTGISYIEMNCAL